MGARGRLQECSHVGARSSIMTMMMTSMALMTRKRELAVTLLYADYEQLRRALMTGDRTALPQPSDDALSRRPPP